MTSDEVFERVKIIVAEKLGIEEDEISLSSELVEDLGADSLDLVDLVMAFEDEFGTKVEDEEIESINTVEDIVKYIKKKTGESEEEDDN
ncbi:MAG TPA: acyl carrier protein [Kosmotogaceae bacterium]|nr:MAG: Acyl carrier protein [Thermotogales bacterium 46_20]HAA85932.1 acyl carrier protein [Kosmotogaceae bacterium]